MTSILKHMRIVFVSAAFLAVGPVLGLGFGANKLLVAPAAAKEAKGPEITSTVLENGLQVVVIPDLRAPVVTHMVWYKVGSADEPQGKSGIAHYLEHLMFKGTKTAKDGEFSARVAAVGGQENAFTSTDYTGYYQRVSPEALEDMMRFEADRMENLILTDAQVEPERSVIIEERNSRTDNEPAALFRESMMAALFRNHRYGVPIIGWRHEIEKLTKDDAIEFYDKYYTPNNAVLVVAGNVVAKDVIEMAKGIYGKVARRAEPGPRARASEPPSRAPRRIAMTDPRVTLPSFQRQYLVPSYMNSKDGPALDILSEILGGSSTSRIYKRLQVKDQIVSSAGAWYQGSSLDDTVFGFYGTPLPTSSVEAVEAAIDEEIRKVLTEGVTQEEVDRAQKRLLRSAIFAQDSQATLARIYGASLAVGSTIEDIKAWPDQISKVTVEQVNEAARKHLVLKHSVTGTLSPEPKSDTPKEG